MKKKKGAPARKSKPRKVSADVDGHVPTLEDLRKHIKAIHLTCQSGGDVFRKLTDLPFIDTIVMHDILYNAGEEKISYPILLQFRRAFARSKAIEDYPSRSVVPRALSAQDPMTKAFFNLQHYAESKVNQYPVGIKGDVRFHIFIAGMTSISIQFTFDTRKPEHALIAHLLLDVLHQSITKHLVNRAHMDQAAIVGLVRSQANDFLDVKKFMWILEGNARLLYQTFGFTRIVFLLSPDMRLLMDGKEGCSFNYESKIENREVGEVVHDAAKIDESIFQENLRTPLQNESEARVLLYSPNYSKIYIRDVLTLNVFMATLKTIFENSYNIMLDRLQALQVQETLKRSSEMDYLTKLLNRNGFYRLLSEKVRRNTRVMLIEIDIDNFKRVNDNWGHEAGDQVLILIARHMNDSFTRNTILSRFGGEEFYILIPNQTLEDGLRMLDNFRQRIASTPMIYQEGTTTAELNIAVSCGASIISIPEGEKNIEVWLKPYMIGIDKALYTAKHNGKNCIYYEDDGEIRRYLHQFIHPADK